MKKGPGTTHCEKKIGEVWIIQRNLPGSGFLLVAINELFCVKAKCSKELNKQQPTIICLFMLIPSVKKPAKNL